MEIFKFPSTRYKAGVIFNSEFEEYINSYPINIEGLTDGIYCVRIIDCKQQLIDKLTFIKAH